MLDPWLGLLWTYGHSCCISAIAVGVARGTSNSAALHRPGGTWWPIASDGHILGQCCGDTVPAPGVKSAQMRVACKLRTSEASSALVRFAGSGSRCAHSRHSDRDDAAAGARMCRAAWQAYGRLC